MIKTHPGLQSAWPVILLVVVILTLPCLGMVWLMTRAMENERFAIWEKLSDAYRPDLAKVVSEFEQEWEDRITRLGIMSTDEPAAATFRQVSIAGEWDSAVIFDGTGTAIYPDRPNERSLHGDGELDRIRVRVASATDPARLVESVTDTNRLAIAFQERAREWLQSGSREEALAILTDTLQLDPLRGERAESGRVIGPDALFLAMRVIDDPNSPLVLELLEPLMNDLNEYVPLAIPSRQRLHLMEEIHAWIREATFPTLEAERWAWRYLDSAADPPEGPGIGPSSLSGVWHAKAQRGDGVGLIREEKVWASFQRIKGGLDGNSGYRIDLVAQEEIDEVHPPFLVSGPMEQLPGYRVTLSLVGENPFQEASERQIAAYRLVAIGVFAVTLCLAIGVGYLISRQMRLTRLKNDLIATVSHELKTPLASTRLLVDTLIAGKIPEGAPTREYLEMIAKENHRLSRLIENFLTFSRMERNRIAFESTPIDPTQLAETALASVEDRFRSNGVRLDVNLKETGSVVKGDPDALATAILNLLENAYKYSEDPKEIRFETSNGNGEVVFEVSDNGIGIPRRARKKIFDRFYQVDQSLSRTSGGCGLGLAIVDFIVKGHGGRVEVDSEVGKGSRFRIRLPAESIDGNRTDR